MPNVLFCERQLLIMMYGCHHHHSVMEAAVAIPQTLGQQLAVVAAENLIQLLVGEAAAGTARAAAAREGWAAAVVACASKAMAKASLLHPMACWPGMQQPSSRQAWRLQQGTQRGIVSGLQRTPMSTLSSIWNQYCSVVWFSCRLAEPSAHRALAAEPTRNDGACHKDDHKEAHESARHYLKQLKTIDVNVLVTCTTLKKKVFGTIKATDYIRE
jgi:hypothetical protein